MEKETVLQFIYKERRRGGAISMDHVFFGISIPNKFVPLAKKTGIYKKLWKPTRSLTALNLVPSLKRATTELSTLDKSEEVDVFIDILVKILRYAQRYQDFNVVSNSTERRAMSNE